MNVWWTSTICSLPRSRTLASGPSRVDLGGDGWALAGTRRFLDESVPWEMREDPSLHCCRASQIIIYCSSHGQQYLAAISSHTCISTRYMKNKHIANTNLCTLALQIRLRVLSRYRAQRATFERRVFWCIEFDPEVICKSTSVLRRQRVRHELPKARSNASQRAPRGSVDDGYMRTDEVKVFLRRPHSGRHLFHSMSSCARSSDDISGTPLRSGASLSDKRAI